MKKPWSISTTVRNPERIKLFLKVLADFEGVLFDEEQQIKYQTKLIQNKLYKPMGLNESQEKYYSSPKEMSFAQAKEIFQHMRNRSTELNKDPGLRGRCSAAPLGKMGLARIKKNSGNLKITEFGKKFLSGEYDLGDVFLRYFYNWSLHNPDDNNFSKDNGFNIRPFIGTINLISLVNKASLRNDLTVKGLSKEENWLWNNFDMFKFTKGDFQGAKLRINGNNYKDMMDKNPLSWAMTSGQNIEYTLEEPDKLP